MKEKRKRHQSRRFHNIPYTLIGIGIIVVSVILGIAIGTTIISLPDQPLRAEWNGYATQTASYKATHNPVLIVTQTVAAIETQWSEISLTQTAITPEQRGE